MGTKINSNYSDLLTFTRASKGHALRPVSYGDELVTNGDFSSSDGWTLKSNTTISGGQLTIDTTSDSSWYSNALRSDIDIVAGKIYYYEVDIESQTPSDQLWVYIGGGSVTDDAISLQGTGVITGVHIPTKSTSTLKVEDRHNTPSAHVINSISIKEVTFDQTDGTLTLFEHPNNVPRVEWDADRNRLGLLVEEARTNLFTYSQDFSTWTSFNSDNFTVNYAQAPDGTQTATRFNPEFATDPGVSAKVIRVYRNINSTAGDVVTFSLFVKPVQSSSLYVNNPDGSDVDRDLLVTFNADQSSGTSFWNLKTKTWELIDSDHTAFQEAYPDGWYRIGITYTVANNDIDNNHFISFANRTAQASFDPYPSGEEDAYIWGAQVEEGSFPTSYMKNEGTVSGEDRSADVASIPVADFGYNQSAGTVVAEVVDYTSKPTGSNYVVSLDDNTASNRNQIIRYNNAWIYDVKVSNVTQVSQNLGTTNDPAKVAFAFKLNDFAATEDGDAVVTDTSGTVPNVTKMTIGSAYNNSAQLNGHIKSIKYYPRRLTNAQLQDLTS